jgi:copper oxidase (laccase) domain-containing protein
LNVGEGLIELVQLVLQVPLALRLELLPGVQPEKVHVDGTNTYTSPNYFSHYRAARTGEREGRFATVVVL